MNKTINFESLINFSSAISNVDDVYSVLNITLLSLMGKLGMLRGAIYVNTDVFGFELLINKSPIVLPLINQFSVLEMRKLDKETESEFIENGFDYILPVIDSDGVDTIFLLGNRILDDKITKDEQKYTKLTLNICANALDIIKSKQKIAKECNINKKNNQLLTTLFELSKDFSALLSKDEIIKRFSFYLMGQLMVSKFSIYELQNENLVPISNSLNYVLSENDIQSILKIDNIHLTKKSKLVPTTLYEAGIKVISPIKSANKILAYCLIGSKLSKTSFSDDDIHYIESLSLATGLALENERLFAQELIKQQIENDINTALEIQKLLLPSEKFEFSDYDIFGKSIPSRHISGDYYDVIQLNDSLKLIVIADVSGKGLPAGMIMANFQAALRALIKFDFTLQSLAENLNSIIIQNTSYDKYITAFFALISENHFEYLNAGHNPQILYKNNNETQYLNSSANAIGMFEDYHSDPNPVLNLSKNDIVVLYTDGINEAKNIENIDYGLNNINDVIFKNSNSSSEEICNTIIEDVKNHSINTLQYDDITLVVIKKL